MRRFVDFYSDELKRKVRIPIDIVLKSNQSTQTISVKVPEQSFEVTEESTYYTLAKWEV